MAIPLDRVSRVIINGEWYSVEMGTFRIEELAFVDDEGLLTHPPIDHLAYHFETPNRDEYYGPLSAIDLIKVIEI